MTDNKLRMEAYYYGFDETGQPEIDLILSAVACAGKSFHHTDQWNDQDSPWPGHSGNSPIEWIANAALSAAQEMARLKVENEALRKDAENWQTVQRAMDQLKSDEQGAAIWSACSRILISLASDLNSARSVVTEEGVTKDGVEIGDWRVTVERLAMAKEASHG